MMRLNWTIHNIGIMYSLMNTIHMNVHSMNIHSHPSIQSMMSENDLCEQNTVLERIASMSNIISENDKHYYGYMASTNNTSYSAYILFSENREHLFFHNGDDRFLSKMQDILEPLEIYGEVMQLDGITLTYDHVEFYKNCQSFFIKISQGKTYDNTNNFTIEQETEKSQEIKVKYKSFIMERFIPFYIASTDYFQYDKIKSSNIRAAKANTAKKTNTQSLYVLYNIPQQTAIVVEETNVPSTIWASINNDFIVCYSKCIEQFRTYFHMRTFDTVETVKKHMEKLESVLDIGMSEIPTTSTDSKPIEKTRVMSYIQRNYEINENTEPEFRKKSQEITDELEKEMRIDKADIHSFRIRLSAYLQELGLKKKRFTNGYYYYGMKKKYPTYMNQDISKLSIQEIEEQRNRELNNYLNSTANVPTTKPIIGIDTRFDSMNTDYLTQRGFVCVEFNTLNNNSMEQVNSVDSLDDWNNYASVI